MILRNKLKDPNTAVALGQISLIAGILSSRMSQGDFPAQVLRRMIASEPLFNHVQGFAAGLSIPLLALSIYCNVRGLLQRRASNAI